MLTCSSADKSDMVGATECCERGGLIVLAESLVVVDMAALLGGASRDDEANGRPLGISSDGRLLSVDGLLELGFGEGCCAGRETSMLSLLGSNRRAPAELDGLVGGDGGGCPIGYVCTLLGGMMGCPSQVNCA